MFEYDSDPNSKLQSTLRKEIAHLAKDILATFNVNKMTHYQELLTLDKTILIELLKVESLYVELQESFDDIINDRTGGHFAEPKQIIAGAIANKPPQSFIAMVYMRTESGQLNIDFAERLHDMASLH